MPHSHTRRDVLRAALALTGAAASAGLVGCDIFPPQPPTLPRNQELDALLADTVALGERYQATISAVPALQEQLTPIRDAHQAHAQALAEALGVSVPAPKQAPPAVPPARAAALSALTSAEKAARTKAGAACLTASGRLAPLLGSIAAARASHLEVLK